MQGSWPAIPNWVFGVVPSSPSKSAQATSSSSAPGSETSSSSCTDVSSSNPTRRQLRKPSFSNFSPIAGKAAIEGGLVAVLQAAGGLLRFVGRAGSSQSERRRKRSVSKKKVDGSSNRGLKGSGLSTTSIFVPNVGDGKSPRQAASMFVNRVASMLFGRLGKFRAQNGQGRVHFALPSPQENSYALLPPSPTGNSEEALLEEDVLPKWQGSKQYCQVNMRAAEDGVVVEPKTGVCFPVRLSFDDPADSHGGLQPSCQVLAGVGVRSKSLVRLKSIMIYAFGLYVQPDHLRAQFREKYGGVPPEELKYRSDFYDDVLSQGVDMTVRLVVHYKGLKMAMVRSAFESSLKNRLKKIVGAEEDEGLNLFCSLMSEDVLIFRGTTIDFRWEQGGKLVVGGHRMGTILSQNLCRAFFDLYIGDQPVCVTAKHAIGESLAQILRGHA